MGRKKETKKERVRERERESSLGFVIQDVAAIKLMHKVYFLQRQQQSVDVFFFWQGKKRSNNKLLEFVMSIKSFSSIFVGWQKVEKVFDLEMRVE